MKVRIIYDEMLRQSVTPVTVFDNELKKTATEMFKIMKRADGLGLAANQLGLDQQLLVIGYEPDKNDKDDDLPSIAPLALCNPKILKTSQEKSIINEGCLSLPGLELPVERSAGVTVVGQDLTGKTITVRHKGLAARILQHEIDHLHGVLLTDRASKADRQNLNNYHFANIVFLGSDDFSQVILENLLAAGLNVMAVITETAKRSGRGEQISEPIIKKIATDAGVAVFQPETTDELNSVIKQLKPDLLVLASYGKILPAESLSVPPYGSLNVHPSLLPKYRGATPIQSAILNNEAETGVTIMTMTEKVDAGRVVAQEKVAIDADATTPSLKIKLANVGAKLLLQQIPIYLSGQAKLKVQEPADVTKTHKLTKEMGEIDWSQPAQSITRKIRALMPWPGTFTNFNGQRLKIIAAHLENDHLHLDEVQLEGKKVANWADFKRGYANQLTKELWFGKIN